MSMNTSCTRICCILLHRNQAVLMECLQKGFTLSYLMLKFFPWKSLEKFAWRKMVVVNALKYKHATITEMSSCSQCCYIKLMGKIRVGHAWILCFTASMITANQRGPPVLFVVLMGLMIVLTYGFRIQFHGFSIDWTIDWNPLFCGILKGSS